MTFRDLSNTKPIGVERDLEWALETLAGATGDISPTIWGTAAVIIGKEMARLVRRGHQMEQHERNRLVNAEDLPR